MLFEGFIVGELSQIILNTHIFDWVGFIAIDESVNAKVLGLFTSISEKNLLASIIHLFKPILLLLRFSSTEIFSDNKFFKILLLLTQFL